MPRRRSSSRDRNRRRGGFPRPALHLGSSHDRAVWFDGYVRTYLERDLQDLSAISALPDRTKRLIKSPRLFWGDTGVALHLAGNGPGGAHLENLVLEGLLVWRDARLERAELFYWRTSVGDEVDLVIETEGRLLPIEIKATSRPRLRDSEHLLTFRFEYGDQALPGLLLHTGSAVEWIAPEVLAAPWWKVL